MSLAPSWTDDRVGALKQLVEDGLTATEIGNKLGIGRGAVIGKLARLGIPLAGAWTVPLAPRLKPPPKQREPKPLLSPTDALPAHMRPAARRTLIRPGRNRIYGGEIDVVEVPEARDLPPDESAFACSILELTDERCHWPMGTPGADDFRYCGADAIEGRPYCTRHHRLAHKSNGYRGTWG